MLLKRRKAAPGNAQKVFAGMAKKELDVGMELEACWICRDRGYAIKSVVESSSIRTYVTGHSYPAA